jgi:hypothetical protein
MEAGHSRVPTTGGRQKVLGVHGDHPEKPDLKWGRELESLDPNHPLFQGDLRWEIKRDCWNNRVNRGLRERHGVIEKPRKIRAGACYRSFQYLSFPLAKCTAPVGTSPVRAQDVSQSADPVHVRLQKPGPRVGIQHRVKRRGSVTPLSLRSHFLFNCGSTSFFPSGRFCPLEPSADFWHTGS